MVFCLRMSLEKLTSKKLKNYSLLLADTVIIKDQKRECITSALPKQYREISYTMEDEEKEDSGEVSSEEERKKGKESRKHIYEEEKRVKTGKDEGEKRRELRSRKETSSLEQEQKRKVHQKELQEKKLIELQERLEKNNISHSDKKETVKHMEDLCSYKTRSEYPSELKQNYVFIDNRKESLLVPMNNRMIPFHVNTVKNVSKAEEGQYSFLRINFHLPTGTGITSSLTNITFPENTGQQQLFLKEVSYRSSDHKNISNTFRLIKELIKRVKAKEQERKQKEDLVTQPNLQILKAKKPILNAVTIRPNISGKKTNGTFEGHSNGFRFNSFKGDKIDIIYQNIQHAFFQPCQNELIVLLHFRLHNPIMIGKKKSIDVQLYSEAGTVADDLDMRRRGAAHDIDELQQEGRERAHRSKLNQDFSNFVHAIENLSQNTIEFDIPYRELAFTGAPGRSNVFLIPTHNVLENLAEIPSLLSHSATLKSSISKESM